MKKIILFAALAFSVTTTKSQVVNDSVSIGSSNEVWYKLSDGTKTTQPRNNWDLALETNSFGVSVLFNNIGGNSVYEIANAGPADFLTLDTAGLGGSTPLYNSDTSWTEGALNQASATYGWGEYNPISHSVEGAVVFVIKYTGGAYKKFFIEKVDNITPGNYFYSIIYSNLDNSGMDTAVVVKQTYNTKNFIYYSFTNNAIIDREPVSTEWDLLFTKYYGLTMGQMYPLTGTLQNKGVKVAQADGISDPANYTDYSSHPRLTAINTIGSDWKTFNGSAYTIAANRVYFVQAKDNHIYKIIMTGFTGGATGKSNFTKEDLGTVVGINTIDNSVIASSLYPNPSNGETVKLIFSAETNSAAIATVYDMQGKAVKQVSGNTIKGELNQFDITTSDLANGIYTVQLRINQAVVSQKLIVNN
ncbi:MAG TPA: T9SS type A sorting domain-containing protein [Bacteroidia bacterium]